MNEVNNDNSKIKTEGILESSSIISSCNFSQLKIKDAESEDILIKGIPFSLIKANEYYKNLTGGLYESPLKADGLLFLGMSTEFPEGSDRWGICDKMYAFQYRIFIGDRIGRILIKFEDGTQTNIPLLFGVNVWQYEMYEGLGPNDPTNMYKGGAIEAGPYREPFDSDIEAKKLLNNSLLLTKVGDRKISAYIFAVSGINNTIKSIHILDDGNKRAGVFISAITAYSEMKENQSLPVRMTDINYFHNQKHVMHIRRLSKRLYQYKSEIPDKVLPINPLCKISPLLDTRISFKGNSFADLFTNVLIRNMEDMTLNKVDINGNVFTSTLDAPSFGRYVGYGTFKEQDGAYHDQIWSRDTGRFLLELVNFGEKDRVVSAAQKMFEYLYDKNSKFDVPNWKRVINASHVATPGQMISWSSRENDGHGLIMLFLFSLIRNKCVDNDWVIENWVHFEAAFNWYIWQIENPKLSNFNKVLYSDSEPAGGGGYDMYSNYIAYCAMNSFIIISNIIGKDETSKKWSKYEDILKSGIRDIFEIEDPERGLLFTDTYMEFDSWANGFKMFVPLFTLADYMTYDVYNTNPSLHKILVNTYNELFIDYKSKAYGRMMGYCQAFALQAALMIDNFEDITTLSETTAMMCYHSKDHNYIVSEGVIMHPSMEYWFRNGDLGNLVQQAEIIKCARLIIGIDNLEFSRGLRIIPRLPDTWENTSIFNYNIIVKENDNETRTTIDYEYTRIINGFNMSFKAQMDTEIEYIRFGPFSMDLSNFKISDDNFETVSVESHYSRKFLIIKPKSKTLRAFNLTVTGY